MNEWINDWMIDWMNEWMKSCTKTHNAKDVGSFVFDIDVKNVETNKKR